MSNAKDSISKALGRYPDFKRMLVVGKQLVCVNGKSYVKKLLGRFPKVNGAGKVHPPKVLQLPITYKCNFDCVMCGMQSLVCKSHFSVEQLDTILTNKLFAEVEYVGVNGGEPFLRADLVDCVKVILERLPRLKAISVITNGYFTENIVAKSKEIKTLCAAKNIQYYLSLSLDGIGELQDTMRGRAGAFEKIEQTLAEIQRQQPGVCDSMQMICTVTSINVDYLCEVEAWCQIYGLPVSYNIATVHERINNFDRYESFSVLENPAARHAATEWFHKKFYETGSREYFAKYYYLKTGKRASFCDFRYDGVTVTPDGGLAYCATFSKEIGNALEEDAWQCYYNHVGYRDDLLCAKCDHCSHYTGKMRWADEQLFCKEHLSKYTVWE